MKSSSNQVLKMEPTLSVPARLNRPVEREPGDRQTNTCPSVLDKGRRLVYIIYIVRVRLGAHQGTLFKSGTGPPL